MPYGKICSSLYRQYARIDADEFDIESIQGEILEEAKAYSHETEDPLEILTLLQPHGGKTNLIDFTTDHLIALFFACDRSASLKEDGRLILLEKNEERKNQILRPQNPRNRIIAQKSIFLRHPDGFLNPDDVEIITIPARLKQPLLTYLRKYHDISTETIYNDLHGFITNQHFHESAYMEFHRGLTSQLRGYEVESREEKQAAYEKAIVHYLRALKLKPDLPNVFINRGEAYFRTGNFDLALADFSKAVEQNPNDPDAYIIRGDAYLGTGNFDLALADFSKAVEQNPNDPDAYIIRGDAYFEQGNSKLALADFDKAIELDPDNVNAYVIRGKVYRKNGDLDSAIEDYKQAIDLNLDDAEAYCNLGLVYMEKQNWQETKLNLTVARILKMDIVAEFRKIYESITDFEEKNDVQLPEDIATMLTP